MRVNWFGSLPPAAGPAALYTARMLPFLKGRADVHLWTPQPVWDRGLERWAAVRSFHEEPVPWADVNQADATLYHVGPNDPAEAVLADVLNQHPGVVVLHGPARLPRTWERCLGVMVHDRETFAELRVRGRWPLLLAPTPWAEDDVGPSHALAAYKDHVESLLTFADESRWFCLRWVAEELADRAAKEMRLWSATADGAAELPRTVQEIVTLTSTSTKFGARPLAA